MKLNYFAKPLSIVGRLLATTLFCVSAIAFIWQGAFFSKAEAMAAPSVNLIASADAGDKAKEKVSEDTGRTKNFIRDTEEKVKRTANKNAERVDEATDGDNLFERRAKKDADLIEKRASEDSARTQKAVDNTKNVLQKTIDGIKDAVSK